MNKRIDFFKKNYGWTLFLIGVAIYLVSLIPFDFRFFWLYTFTSLFTVIKFHSYYVECPKCNIKVYKGKKCKKCGINSTEIEKTRYKKELNIKTILLISLCTLLFLIFVYLLMYADTHFELLNPSSDVLYAYFDVIKDFLPILIASVITSIILRIIIKHYIKKK